MKSVYAPDPKSGAYRFSLLRGSGLKFLSSAGGISSRRVLPLTREWIEMFDVSDMVDVADGSPSYEGVD